MLRVVNFGALVNLVAGRKEEARRVVNRVPFNRSMTWAPYILAATGDTAAATRELHEIEARQPRPWFAEAERASVMLAIGDTLRALDLLERSANSSGNAWAIFMPLMDPAFDRGRRSDRFAALVRRANLDEQIFTSPNGGRGP